MPVCATPAQYRRLKGNIAGERSRPQALRLSENDVRRAIVDFLKAQGWTVLRLQSGVFQRPGSSARITIGEVNMPDYCAVSAVIRPGVMFIETKAEGKRPTAGQRKRIDELIEDGFVAVWFDGFDTGNRPFLPWYSLNWG